MFDLELAQEECYDMISEQEVAAVMTWQRNYFYEHKLLLGNAIYSLCKWIAIIGEDSNLTIDISFSNDFVLW